MSYNCGLSSVNRSLSIFLEMDDLFFELVLWRLGQIWLPSLPLFFCCLMLDGGGLCCFTFKEMKQSRVFGLFVISSAFVYQSRSSTEIHFSLQTFKKLHYKYTYISIRVTTLYINLNWNIPHTYVKSRSPVLLHVLVEPIHLTCMTMKSVHLSIAITFFLSFCFSPTSMLENSNTSNYLLKVFTVIMKTQKLN